MFSHESGDTAPRSHSVPADNKAARLGLLWHAGKYVEANRCSQNSSKERPLRPPRRAVPNHPQCLFRVETCRMLTIAEILTAKWRYRPIADLGRSRTAYHLAAVRDAGYTS
jgi:hypothetical protein